MDCSKFPSSTQARTTAPTTAPDTGTAPDHLQAASLVLAPGPRGPEPGPAPQTCPTCGRPYDLFDHDTSRLLDWIERLHQDLHHLKSAVEEVLP